VLQFAYSRVQRELGIERHFHKSRGSCQSSLTTYEAPLLNSCSISPGVPLFPDRLFPPPHAETRTSILGSHRDSISRDSPSCNRLECSLHLRRLCTKRSSVLAYKCFHSEGSSARSCLFQPLCGGLLRQLDLAHRTGC